MSNSFLLQQNQKQLLLPAAMLTSVHILQLTNLQLNSYLHELMISNPMIELKETVSPEIPGSLPIQINYSASSESYHSSNRSDHDPHSDKDQFISEKSCERSAVQDLLLQASALPLSDSCRALLNYLILLLDDNGFLLDSAECIAAELQTTTAKVQECIDILQTLEPIGVGTADVQHALLHQLQVRYGGDAIAASIIENHLEDLACGRIRQIAKKLNVSQQDVKKAKDLIQTLNPKPLNGAGSGLYMHYIIPDVRVITADDGFHCILNDWYIPKIQLSPEYLAILKDKGNDLETRNYLSKCLTQANDISRFVTYRTSTLEQVMTYIIHVQQDFFRLGPGHRVAMSGQQIASYLNLHESTISRAVNGKYFECCWGTFPIRYLFSHSLQSTDLLKQVDYDQIVHGIRQIIASETAGHAYSDEEIMQRLTALGISISRRTVTKYRKVLEIPSSSQRNAAYRNQEK